MRISDWNSDVCSSDLPTMTGCLMKPRTNMPHGPKKRLRPSRSRRPSGAFVSWACARGLVMVAFALLRLAMAWQNRDGRARKESVLTLDRRAPACREKARYEPRSEEHTSELQSLMRIS